MAKKEKRFHYNFTIFLETNSEKELSKEFQIKYSTSNIYKDTIKLQKNQIEITGSREKDNFVEPEDIYNLPFYSQILRAIVYYYAYYQCEIRLLRIEYKKSDLAGNWGESKQFENLSSFLGEKNRFSINTEFPEKVLDEITKNNSKAAVVQELTTYLLQGLYSKDSIESFDKLLKGFNYLFRENGKPKDKTDRDQLDTMEGKLKNDSEKYPETYKYSYSVFKSNYRISDRWRWNKYLENKYSKKVESQKNQREKELKAQLDKKVINQENYDERINNVKSEILKEILDKEIDNIKDYSILRIYEDFLSTSKQELFLSYDKSKITKKLNNPKMKLKEDKQSRVILLTEYAYFLRCSYVHAGNNYAKYNLLGINRYEIEFSVINEFLVRLILENLKILGELETKMETLNCPKCGKQMSEDSTIEPGTKTNSFADCIRRCNTCGIGYSNGKENPTIIYKDYTQSIPKIFRKGLQNTIENSLNTGHIESKKNQFGFSTSEDALTWIFIRYFVNENKLDVLKKVYSLKSPIREILLWGVPQIDDNSPSREKLSSICKCLKESKGSYSEPDIVIITDTEIRFIEVKLGAKNQKKDSPNKYNKYICNDFYSDKDLLIKSKHYELARNWTIGNMFTESKDFKLINQGPSKLFYNDDKELLQKFENSLNDSDRFEKLSWEKIIDTITPSVTNDFLEELNRRLKFVL